jgi:hypothetical protein
MTATLVHSVERLNWRAVRYTDDHFDTEWEGFVLVPGARRLRSFPSADEADAFCRQQEEAMRSKVNPFTCGGPALHYQSSFDDDRLYGWLLDSGLDPPERDGRIDWRVWYDGSAPAMNAIQREAVWSALDRVRFFRVVMRPPGRSVYVVTRREWEYNDEWYQTYEVEGKPIEAYSTWERAEAARQRWERNEQRNWDRTSLEVTNLRWAALQPGDPLLARRDELFAGEDEDRLFYEVIEVELGG